MTGTFTALGSRMRSCSTRRYLVVVRYGSKAVIDRRSDNRDTALIHAQRKAQQAVVGAVAVVDTVIACDRSNSSSGVLASWGTA